MFGFCHECRDMVKYTIVTREGLSEVKGEEVKYTQKIPICNECGKEIFISEIMDENLRTIDKIYRRDKNLIRIEEVQEILEKYDIGKKPLSSLLGWSEVTVTRYIDGQLPSKQYSDELYNILENSSYMREILEKNKNNITDVGYRKVNGKLRDMEHIPREDLEKSSKIEIVSEYIISLTGDITPLALQKLLYYVQGFHLAFIGEHIFEEDCEAWIYGPVYSQIYYKYKDYRYHSIYRQKINIDVFENLLTEDEMKIINTVVSNFGRYSGKILEEMTHYEKPWRNARWGLEAREKSNRIIDKTSIKVYFQDVIKSYDMINILDIKDYTIDMGDKIAI